ncbi:zinc-ribbon domain-containing protein [Bifidobacterium moraviense]|uniref:zinc-ribbon domain-containing protein n=1 Tax=Bifidobacterium moraviense TaxID=2675323 RepID=UPI00145E4359
MIRHVARRIAAAFVALMMAAVALIVAPTAAWAAGAPPVPQQRGNVNLKNYEDVAVNGISDDGSVAVIYASNVASGSSTYFMVTLNDVSITELAGAGVISTDGKQVYFVDTDSGKLKAADVASKQITTLNGSVGGSEYVVGATADRVLISDYSGSGVTLNTYDVKQQRVTATTKISSSSAMLGVAPDYSHVFAVEPSSSGSSATLQAYDLTTGQSSPAQQITGPSGIDYSNLSVLSTLVDGKALLVSSYSSSASAALYYRLDVTNGRLTYLSDHPYTLTTNRSYTEARYVLGFDGPAGDPANGVNLSKVSDASSMSVYDIAAGRAAWTTSIPAGIDAKFESGNYLGLTNDGKHMLVASQTGTSGGSLISMDTKTGATSEVRIPDEISGGYGGAAMLSGDGATVVVATTKGDDSQLLIFSTGVGGSPWTKVETWLMVAAGSLAVIVLIVVAIILLRKHGARKAVAGAPIAPRTSAGYAQPQSAQPAPSAQSYAAASAPAQAVSVPAQSAPRHAASAAPTPASPSAPTVPATPAVPTVAPASVAPAPTSAVAPAPDQSASDQSAPAVRFCTECGTRVTRPTAKFCPGCGHPLGS